MVLGYFGLGRIIYVSLLFTNAIAILNEERFLAKSECWFSPRLHKLNQVSLSINLISMFTNHHCQSHSRMVDT